MLLILFTCAVLFLCWFFAFQVYACIIGAIVSYRQSRIHFIEIHEEKWCPFWVRELTLNCVIAMWCNFGLPHFIGSRAQTVANVIYQNYAQNSKKSCTLTILDMCSGTGGPAMAITDELANKLHSVTTILTDLFPHLEKWRVIASNNSNMAYCTQPVDATNIQIEKVYQNLNSKEANKGKNGKNENNIHLRTIFGALHHFKPDAIISILSDAMKSNDEFMTVELTQRYGIHRFISLVFGQCIFVPLLVFYAMRYYLFDHKQLSLVERVWYVLLVIVATPIYISCFIHDGIISYARSYREDELWELVNLAKIKAKKESDEYEWRLWKQDSNLIQPFNKMFPLIVLYGRPNKSKK